MKERYIELADKEAARRKTAARGSEPMVAVATAEMVKPAMVEVPAQVVAREWSRRRANTKKAPKRSTKSGFVES